MKLTPETLTFQNPVTGHVITVPDAMAFAAFDPQDVERRGSAVAIVHASGRVTIGTAQLSKPKPILKGREVALVTDQFSRDFGRNLAGFRAAKLMLGGEKAVPGNSMLCIGRVQLTNGEISETEIRGNLRNGLNLQSGRDFPNPMPELAELLHALIGAGGALAVRS